MDENAKKISFETTFGRRRGRALLFVWTVSFDTLGYTSDDKC